MNREVYDDNSDELEELELDDRWSGKTSPTLWSDDVALPDELLKLREELEQENNEARAWLEEECAADEILRSEINELQIAQQKNQNLLSLELQLPPEVREKISSLEIQVRTLQDEVQDKSDKLAQTYEVYSEVLSKLNETNERVIANDDKFKQSLLKVKDEYAQIEQVLKSNLETYKTINKELQLQLNEKESELNDIKENQRNALEVDESLKIAEEKIQSLTSSNESLSKYNLKIKAHLKKLKESEKEILQKNKEALDRIEVMSNNIAELEEENLKLKEQSSNSENIEALINRITLLEEEKGNLQLQLVDLDEVKESAVSAEARVADLEKEKDSLLLKLQEVEERNIDLNNGYEKAKEKLLEHEETIASLKDALQKANDEKISSAMKLVEMEENSAQSDLASEKLRNRYEHDLAKLTDEIHSYKSSNQSLITENQELKAQKDSLDISLKELKNEKVQKDDNLSNKYKQLVVNYKKKKQLCIDLEAELLQLKQEKSPQIENVLENLSVKEKEFDLLNELYNKEVSRNQGLMSDLNKLQLETQEISSLYSNQISFLEEQISSFTPNIVFLQSQMEQKTLFYNEKLSELVAKLEKYENDVEILKKDEEFLKNKIVNVQAEFDDVQEMLEATQLRNTTVEKELKDALATIDGLSAEIGILREAQSVQEDLESTRSALNKISMDLQESQTRNLTLEENLKKASLTIEELQMKNHEKISLQNTIQENQATIEKISFDLQQIHVRNADLEEELKKAYGKIESMSFELQSAQEMKMKNLELEEQLRNASITLNQMSSENQKHRPIEDELNEARAIIDRMGLAQQETQMKNASLEEEVKKAYGTIEKMSLDLQSLHEVHLKNGKLENELRNLQSSIDETSSELNNLREIRDAYNTTLDKIEVLNLDLNKTIESFETTNSERDNLLQERETLVMRLNELEDLYAELESKHAMSEMTVENLQSDVDSKEIQLKEMENRLIQNTQFIEQLQLSLNEKTNQHSKEIKEPEMKVFTFGEENPFGELKDEEDGWGWKGEGDKEIQKIKEERDSLLSELDSYKLKCQKYIKKIKEMKSEMEKNKKDDFGDFGLAIQEELRNENDTLSKKLAELNSQLNSFKNEKENLLKRVETLTSANDALIDMKERQDIEVQMWQKRSNELATQLKGMEIAGNGDSAIKIAELSSELETAKKQLALLQRNDDSENADLSKDIDILKDSLEAKQKENVALKIECENLKKELSSYSDRMREIDDYYQQTILTKDEENSHLICTISSRDKSLEEAKKEKEKLEEMLKLQSNSKEDQKLKTFCDEYTNRIQEKEEEINEKNRQITELESYISNIENCGERNQEIERLAEMVSQSHIRLEALSEQLAIKNQELLQVHEQMSNFNDYEEIKSSLSSIQQEKINLEKLLEEKFLSLQKLEKELEAYKNTKESDLLKNKDLEIERLSNILNVTREKLVQKIQTEEARMSPYVKTIQNKLDQALYTVHERDVRIEELTREIHELLMERDTLQIKLSEYMRAYNLLTSQEPSKGQNIATIDTRITELQAGYNKDPVVQKERESRHIEHMQLYQSDSQAEDNASADYGIFNWFFGGSPQPTRTSNENQAKSPNVEK